MLEKVNALCCLIYFIYLLNVKCVLLESFLAFLNSSSFPILSSLKRPYCFLTLKFPSVPEGNNQATLRHWSSFRDTDGLDIFLGITVMRNIWCMVPRVLLKSLVPKVLNPTLHCLQLVLVHFFVSVSKRCSNYCTEVAVLSSLIKGFSIFSKLDVSLLCHLIIQT